MKKIQLILILNILFFNYILAQEIYFQEQNLYKDEKLKTNLISVPEFTPRRITGLVYSTFIPGSGQIYLGSKTKGSFIALAYITSLVGAVVSQNNFIGNRERIESLQFEYLNADRYTLAEYYWKQMLNVHEEQKLHEKARNVFTLMTVFVWTINIIDYIFLTKDRGPTEFSQSLHLNSLAKDDFSIFSVSLPLKIWDAK